MYGSEYEEEQKVSDNGGGSFYQNNRVLVWIFIAIVLIAIVVVVIKKKGDNPNNDTSKYTVSIYPENDITIVPGRTTKLVAIANNNADAVITWSSSDESIATVDNGTVTAIKYGEVYITASYVRTTTDSPSAKKKITVAEGKKDITLSDISIKDGNLTMPINGTYSIVFETTPTDAYIFEKKFTSSNENVVTVDDNGFVKSVGEGEAVITVTVNNNITRSLKAFVSNNYESSEIVPNPTKLTLSKEVNTIKVGGSARISYTVEPVEANKTVVNWTSSDETVLTVDKNGIIQALKEGTATIKISALNEISDSLEIEVTPSVVIPTDIELPSTDVYVDTNQSKSVIVTVLPADATDKTIACTSSNSSVAQVTTSGSTCTVKGVSAGTATITIRTNSGGITKAISVTVTDPVPESSSSSGGGSSSGSSCSKPVTKCSSSKVCPAGKYCSGGCCHVCQQGYYCSNNKRTACPSGKSSAAGATSSSDCSPCAKGYYLSNRKCVACPDGKTTASSGATSKSQCNVDASTVCKAGTYRSGNSCTPCPTGYTSSSGATSKNQCYRFISGGYGIINNGTPYQCIAGTYSVARTVQYNKDSRCTACPKNTYQNERGKSSCKPCPSDSDTNGQVGQTTCTFG